MPGEGGGGAAASALHRQLGVRSTLRGECDGSERAAHPPAPFPVREWGDARSLAPRDPRSSEAPTRGPVALDRAATSEILPEALLDTGVERLGEDLGVTGERGAPAGELDRAPVS